jgi:hypothetical protein
MSQRRRRQSLLPPREPHRKIALPLPVGSLENLALSRVVPEQLLNQIDVRKQHATAAVAVESQLAQRLSN